MLKLVKDNGNVNLSSNNSKVELTTPTILVGEASGGLVDGGVYIGIEEPPKDALLWLNPEGEEFEIVSEEEVDAKIAAIEIPEVDFTGYATEDYVDEAVKSVDVTEQLKDYAKTEDIPSLDGLATETYVDEAVASVDVTEQLADYALKTDIPSLDGYAKTEDIPDVSGFLNEEQVMALIEEFSAGELPASEEVEF